MLNYRYVTLAKNKLAIATTLSGKPLLTTPQLNKGTAFSRTERIAFGLVGKLPSHIETIEQQVKRAYSRFSHYTDKLNRNTYLQQLHNINEVLFYRLASDYLSEVLPTIYTPIVGSAVKLFSHTFSQARGLYISYHDRGHISDILANRSNPEIDLIVVTDGEGVLGLGDQGIGGMDIPVAKLMVYTLCAGIDPRRTLPIFLDVGTNNKELLNDPLYLGWRHKRVRGKAYDDFIAEFVAAVQNKLPSAFLHWEDFGRDNATRILNCYREKLCTFNDDAQGTGAVTLAAILAAGKLTATPFAKQRIVIFGGGTAGMGITMQIFNALCQAGLSAADARKCFWIIDRHGLLTEGLPDLTPEQKPFARNKAEIKDWLLITATHPGLLEVVLNVKPTVLIGASGVANAFSKEVIAAMANQVAQPLVLPLSNPPECCEAQPQDIITWTQGKALIATGSPFEPVSFQQKNYVIPQCNNALIFPGLGLGVLAAAAKQLTDGMLWAACQALAKCSPASKQAGAPLLPSLENPLPIAKKVALAVATQARLEGVAGVNDKVDLLGEIRKRVWKPEYLPLVKDE